MAKRLNPEKTVHLPDSKRVRVVGGQVKIDDRTPKMPIKTG